MKDHKSKAADSGEGAPPDETHAVAALKRRQFLKQGATVSALVGGAGYLSLAPPDWPLSLSDVTGERGKPTSPALSLPENGFAVERSKTLPTMSVAHGNHIPDLLKGAVAGLGGINLFIKKGDVVVIKPNVAFERGPALGATSNPEVLKALIHLVRDAGAAEVRVCDNPIESPEACFVRSGIQKAALDAGARLYLPGPSDFQTLATPGAKWIERWPFFWRPFLGADKVIGVAPVKDHNLCHASMTTKNWYGLLGGRRNQFHQDIHGIITDLAQMMKPTFVILDGTRVLFRSGPTGGSLSDVKAGRTLIASTDSLACDAYGWDHLLERKAQERPAYLSMATQKGFGTQDYTSIGTKEVHLG